MVTGKVVLRSSGKATHSTVRLTVEGKAKLGVSAASVGMFEAFYSTTKPVLLVSIKKELAPKSDMPDGVVAIPFEFRLEPLGGEKILETYHGVYVTVMYNLGVETSISAGFMSKTKIQKEIDFVVEAPVSMCVLWYNCVVDLSQYMYV